MKTPDQDINDNAHLSIQLKPKEVADEQIKTNWDAIEKAIKEFDEENKMSAPSAEES